MSDQYVKYLAQQAGPFTAAQNVVDIELPGGSVYDLRDSYIQVTASVTSVDAGAGSGTGVYSPQLVFTSSNFHFPNAALVKNCSLTTDGRGQIESLRRSDVIAQLKAAVNRSQRQDASAQYLSCNSVVDPEGNDHYSPFLDVRKSGTVPSSLHSVPFPIRLGDLMDSCNTSYYDARRLGTSRFRFELHAPQTIVAQQTIPANTATYSWINLTDVAVSVGGAETNDFTTKVGVGDIRVIPTLRQIPLYVGMKIKITATNSGTGAVEGVSVITSMNFNETTGQLAFSIQNVGTLDRAAGQGLSAIQIAEITQPQSFAVSFDRVELVAKRLGSPGPSREMSMPFRTYSTIEDQGVAGATIFQRQYPLQPECDAVMIAFPGATTPWSINTNITDYRLRLNQQDLTDRPVGIRSPLYYDQLSSTFNAMAMTTRNLRLNVGDSSAATYGAAYPAGSNQVIVGSPLPQTLGTKDLQVNLELSGNDVQQIVLFNSIPRNIIV